jgi:glycine cleavage system H protein
MSQVPSELRYTKDHEWARDNGDGTLTVGITDHAQEALGDLVFVEVPEPGREVALGEACAVVESVKAASDIFSPLAGTVAEVNGTLADTPERINEDPYGAGWIFKLVPKDSSAFAGLMDPDAYAALLDDD